MSSGKAKPRRCNGIAELLALATLRLVSWSEVRKMHRMGIALFFRQR